jgi:hypothetical protein
VYTVHYEQERVRVKKAAKPAAGRPARHQGERLSKNRTFRVRGQLDEQLSAAAEKSGRSVSEEIEFRLDRTFAGEHPLSLFELIDLAYGQENIALIMSIAELIRSIGANAPQLALARSKHEQPGANWIDDPFLFDEVVKSINELLGSLRPEGEAVAPKNYQESLRNIGKRSAHAILAILAGTAPVAAELVRSGWAARTAAKVSPSTMFRIQHAAGRNANDRAT